MQYNSRLQATQLEIGGRNPQYGPPTAAKTQFSYYGDGSLQYAHDVIDERFDRAFARDQVAMVKEAYTGSEARDFVNNTSSGAPTGPYRQSYQHDPFGNMTRRDNRFWSANDTLIANYTNHRRTDAGFQYDADGNLIHDPDVSYSYDAAGRNVSITSPADQRMISSLDDGNGQPIKRTVTQFGNTSFTYYVRSSVLGGRVISELTAQGQKQIGYVFAGRSLLAKQENNIIIWKHENPITGSQGESTTQGAYFPKAEFDAMGVDVGFEDPYINCCGGGATGPEFPMLIGGFGIPDGRCQLDGMAIDCGWAMEMLSNGSAVQCPNNDCGPRAVYVDITYMSGRRQTYSGLTNPFTAYADGRSGFMFGGMLLPDGFNMRFTGPAARAAASSFFSGMANGNFGSAVTGAIRSGVLANMIMYFADPQKKGVDDCHKFAQMLQGIADKANDVHEFLDTIARTFTGAHDSSNAEIAAAANRNLPKGSIIFADSGFKPQFQDGSNQVRHFVAGFVAGANLGPIIGLYEMNQHEEPNSHHENDPDIRLNAVSTDIGSRYGGNIFVGINIIRSELVGEFTHRVCE